MYIFLCEDTVDGIFTAVYRAWESKYGLENIKIQAVGENNYELFAEYVTIETDSVRALKVANTLRKRFGQEAYTMICHAAMSGNQDKAESVFRGIIFGLSLANGKDLANYYSNDAMLKLFELSRRVGGETHSLKGFIRFKQLKSGILFAKIHPKNHVLALLSPHFEDRLPNENWVIYDEGRKQALIHKCRYVPVIVSAESMDLNVIEELAEDELEFEKLWKVFFESITIKERINPKLQQQHVPLYFRSNMLEF